MLSTLFFDLYHTFKTGLSLNLGLTFWVDWQASNVSGTCLSQPCLQLTHTLQVPSFYTGGLGSTCGCLSL